LWGVPCGVGFLHGGAPGGRLFVGLFFFFFRARHFLALYLLYKPQTNFDWRTQPPGKLLRAL